MQLEKWYCDVVDSDQVRVRYCANLHLGGVVIGYRGSIAPGVRTESCFQVKTQPLPILRDGVLHWPEQPEPLRFEQFGQAGPTLPLYDTPADSLTWQPIVLNARATGPGLSKSARGYAEVLRMNFGPWKLGLQRLLWGRFCGQRHSLVWIVWEGRHAQQLALLDGEFVALEAVDTNQVVTALAQLCFEAPQLLVRERMDHGALKGIPLQGPLSRLAFLRGLECKWHSPATLRLAGEVDTGHAIYEEVTWD